MEPERPIEQTLLDAARKRRESAGAPIELHPATRRMLQGEVARQYGPAQAQPPQARPASGFWKMSGFWPKVVWGFGLVLMLGVIVSQFLPGPDRASRERMLAQNEAGRFQAAPELAPAAPGSASQLGGAGFGGGAASASKAAPSAADTGTGPGGAVALDREAITSSDRAITMIPPTEVENRLALSTTTGTGARAEEKAKVEPMAKELAADNKTPTPSGAMSLADRAQGKDVPPPAAQAPAAAAATAAEVSALKSAKEGENAPAAGDRTTTPPASAAPAPAPTSTLAPALSARAPAPRAPAGPPTVAPVPLSESVARSDNSRPSGVPAARGGNLESVAQADAAADKTGNSINRSEALRLSASGTSRIDYAYKAQAPAPQKGSVDLAEANTAKLEASRAVFADELKNGQSPAVAQRFYRVDLAGAAKAARTKSRAVSQPVLASFEVQQSGADLRVIEPDGSVYTGQLEWGESAQLATVPKQTPSPGVAANGPAARRRLDSQPQAAAASAPATVAEPPANNGNELRFRVSGTNRTLRQNVVFSGNLVLTDSNGAPLNSNNQTLGRAFNSRFGQSPSISNQAPSLPLLNSRITGRAQIGTRQQVEINALPSQR